MKKLEFFIKPQVNPEIASYFERPFPDSLLEKGIGMTLPINLIQGIQELREYSKKKTKTVDKLYQQYGAINVLRQYPPIVCAIPNTNTKTTDFILLDGHHRVRRAPKFGCVQIPVIVISIETYAEYVREEVQKTATKLYRMAYIASKSFDQRMK